MFRKQEEIPHDVTEASPLSLSLFRARADLVLVEKGFGMLRERTCWLKGGAEKIGRASCRERVSLTV